MVLTEESQQDVYPALTFEGTWTDTTTAVAIEKLYYNVDSSKIVNASVATGITAYQNNNGNPPFNNNPKSNTTANSAKVYQMNGSVNKTGLTIALKVMAGDTINIYGKSYYNLNGGTISGTTTAPTTLALLTSFAGTNAMSSKGVSGTALNSITQLTSGITSLLGTQPAQTSNTPKAFINWILFDERFNYAGGGYDRVGSSGTVKNHNSSTIPSIVVPKNGYIYVYCSNESNINVFFDNLQVIHSRGPIVEETHYYPFGLVMSGISSKAANTLQNKFLYSGKELHSKEFSDGSGLELYEFGARNYDVQIGRWTTPDPLQEDEYIDEDDELEAYESQVQRFDFIQNTDETGIAAYRLSPENSAVHYDQSPYNFVRNNPLLYIDPYGLDTAKGKMLPEVVVVGVRRQSTLPWWGDAGVLYGGYKMIQWGQPIVGKRFITQGTATSVAASPGTSKASTYLSKKLDKTIINKGFQKLPGVLRKAPVGVPKVLGGKGARMAITKSVGRFAGRWVPVVGWGLLAYDIYDNRKEIKEFTDGVRASNEFNRTRADGSWSSEWAASTCFVKGTLIFGKDSLIAIDKVKIGDTIYSYNIEKSKIELSTVLNTFKRETQGIYEIKAGNEIIFVTAEHPMYVLGKGWIKVKDLKNGYVLKSFDDEAKIKIKSIKRLVQNVMVYNIEVDGNHDYFVTDSKILVHNKSIKPTETEVGNIKPVIQNQPNNKRNKYGKGFRRN